MSLQIKLPTLIVDAVKNLYSAGLPRGDSTGWRGIDELYTVAPKQWTLVSGVPGMGKSEWLDALLVNVARAWGWTFALYSPENFPVELHVAKLAEKYIGKPFGRGPTERMTEGEVGEALNWINEHFMWLEPAYKNHDALLEAAAKHRCASDKFGVVIDPWNQLEHLRPAGLSETEYIARALSDVTQWVRVTDSHAWIVAHPSKLYRGNDGKYPVPTGYDIAGSAHWFNKSDNIIVINRDKTGDTQEVEIWVQKVRFRNIGKVGLGTLSYDRVTGRYFERPPIHLVESHDYASRDD